MYQCRHFVIQELVPPQVYADRGEKAWELLDERALRTLDALRDEFGSCTVNNWHIGGSRKWSGLRTASCGVGTEYSQHRFGRAFDCIFSDISAQAVRSIVLRTRKEMFPYISGMELNVTWFHFDCRNHTPLKTFGEN